MNTLLPALAMMWLAYRCGLYVIRRQHYRYMKEKNQWPQAVKTTLSKPKFF